MTAYEMRISDWSAVVCSSDLQHGAGHLHDRAYPPGTDAGRDQAGRRRRRAEGQRPQRTAELHPAGHERQQEIGRESWRARGGQYVWISVEDVSLKNTYTRIQSKAKNSILNK